MHVHVMYRELMEDVFIELHQSHILSNINETDMNSNMIQPGSSAFER